MNSLKKTLKNLPTDGRIGRMQLSRCLQAFGVPKGHYKDPMGRPTLSQRTYALNRLGHWGLVDLYKNVRVWWIYGCKLIQTQFVENHEMAAAWNALWQRIKHLFEKRGAFLS